MRGDRIRNLREALGLSQEQLAIRLGMGEAQIWRYEKGESAPRADALIKMADFFNVSVDYLLGRNNGQANNLDGLTPREVAAISAWRRGERLEAIKVIGGDE